MNPGWTSDYINSRAQVLIEKAKKGNANAFHEIYCLYRNQVYGLCLRLTRSIPDAEDLTQETFVQVKRKLNDFSGKSAFGSWLYRVSFNLTMMFFRKQRIAKSYAQLADVERAATGNLSEPPFHGCEPVSYLALKRAIASLPPGRRNVVILHDVNGLTHHEVGLRLGIAANTSKSQLHKAHLTLRSILSARAN